MEHITNGNEQLIRNKDDGFAGSAGWNTRRSRDEGVTKSRGQKGCPLGPTTLSRKSSEGTEELVYLANLQ